MLTPTLQVTRIQPTPQILTMPFQEQGLLSDIQATLSSGVANFKLRLHFLLLKLSILPCLKRYMNNYQYNSFQMKSTTLFLSTLQQQTSASQSTKIIYLPLQWQSCSNLLCVQNTSLLSNTIFEAKSRQHIIHRAKY